MEWQDACVQNVLDSIVPALLADKNRKFIYVEQVSQSIYSIFINFFDPFSCYIVECY